MNTLSIYFFFQPYILQPTRITNHSTTLIDNIFFNSLEYFAISGNIIYDLTDHLPSFLILNKFSSLPPNVKIFKRDYFRLNESVLINEIQAVEWEELFSTDPIPTILFLFNVFYTKLTEIIDQHITVKQLSKRELKIQSKPLMTFAIIGSLFVSKINYIKNILKQNPLIIILDSSFIEIN